MSIWVAASASATITPAVQYGTVSIGSSPSSYTLGYDFQLSSSVVLNALGYWDDGLGNSHVVGIWHQAVGLVVSTTVQGNDPLTAGFRWGGIAATTLSAGTYTIGGFYRGQEPYPVFKTGVTTIPEYTWLADEQIVTPDLAQPNFSFLRTFNAPNFFGPNGLLVANFSVETDVPEPGAAIVLGLGFAMLHFAQRRQARMRSS